MKTLKLLPAEVAARVFVLVAAVLGTTSALLAVPSLLEGDFGQGLLLAGVAVFAGWMATAIHQFQQRLAGIDEVVRQGKRRVEQSEAVSTRQELWMKRPHRTVREDEWRSGRPRPQLSVHPIRRLPSPRPWRNVPWLERF